MDFTQGLSSLLGIGLASGLNLYAVVLTVGLAQRFEWITGMPEGLAILAHPAVLASAAVLYGLEFVADKIPGITPIWDGLHTFIRPVGAALVALGAFGQLDPLPRTLAMLAAGTLALGAHATKMGTRLAAHAAPDPATHSAISIAEDFGVVGIILLAYNYPWVALPVLLAMLAGILVALPFLYRVTVFLWQMVRGRFAGLPRQTTGIRGYIRSGAGLGRLRQALLRTSSDKAELKVRGWFREKSVELHGPGRYVEGMLLDYIEWSVGKGKFVSLYLTKDWAALYRAAR